MQQKQSQLDIKEQSKKLEKTLKMALEYARKKGASETEVSAGISAGFEVNVRLGEVDTLEYEQDKSFEITVYFSKRSGSTSTSDLSEASIQMAIDKACDIAKYTSEDPCSGLADKSLMAFDYPDIDIYHPWNIDPQQAIEMAKRCEALGMQMDKRIDNSEGAHVSTHEAISAYANSHDFIGMIPGSMHNIGCVLVAKEGKSMQRDYDFTMARDPAKLTDTQIVAQQTADKTLKRLGAKPISTRTAPVIFSSELARGLIGTFAAAVSGSNLYRESSFLPDSLNTQVLPGWMTLEEKPHEKNVLGSSPFDADGVATKNQILVKEGILQHYILSNYSAKKLGLKTTANCGGLHNLQVSCYNLSLQDLLKQMDTGFYVTELIGHGVNIVTGDYSRGASGFWVEKGVTVQPVEEVTIAGNLKNMLMNIVAIANDIDERGNIKCGSILLDAMKIAGK